MFSVFYFMFMGCASLFDSAKNGWHRMKDKEKAEQAGLKEYVDNRGHTWYGNIRATHGYVNGMRVLQSVETGQILRNYDDEEIIFKERWFWEHYDKNRREAIKKKRDNFVVFGIMGDKRSGLYETKTGKRIFISSFGPRCFKYYYKTNVMNKNEVDWKSVQEITKEEWQRLGGKRGEIDSLNH